MTRKAIALIATSFVVVSISTAALAASKQTTATADRDVRILIQMMDKDKDGVVSKDEFMQFMSGEFDRLDVDKTGKLESRHLRPIRNPSWPLGGCARRAFPECSGGGGQ
jgi:Ca2+-binding EF-hand superfamily protein